MTLREYLSLKGNTQAALAEKLDVTQGFVSHWINGRSEIPAEKVIPIYKATNGVVTPFEMRPDLYPDPNWELKLDASAA